MLSWSPSPIVLLLLLRLPPLLLPWLRLAFNANCLSPSSDCGGCGLLKLTFFVGVSGNFVLANASWSNPSESSPFSVAKGVAYGSSGKVGGRFHTILLSDASVTVVQSIRF
jgi:hypothetical protein